MSASLAAVANPPPAGQACSCKESQFLVHDPNERGVTDSSSGAAVKGGRPVRRSGRETGTRELSRCVGVLAAVGVEHVAVVLGGMRAMDGTRAGRDHAPRGNPVEQMRAMIELCLRAAIIGGRSTAGRVTGRSCKSSCT